MKDDRYYKNMSEDERRERLERAKNNSVTSRNPDIAKVEYKGERYRINAKRLKVAVVTAFLATAIACTALGYGLSKGIDHLEDEYDVYQEISSYAHIVHDNTHRTSDNQGYWYDTLDMGDDILKKEDKAVALYAAYEKMTCGTYENKMKHMDQIIDRMRNVVEHYQETYPGIKTYSNFTDYLIQNECIDKDGNPSFKVYEEKMKDYILNKDNKIGQSFNTNYEKENNQSGLMK